MKNQCRQCQALYEVFPEDLLFYEKMSPVFLEKIELIPPPTLCVACRAQRRMAWRNERSLYHRKCDKTNKPIISIYSPNSPFIIYCQNAWWSDDWDAIEFGRSFDDSQSFFEQFAELQKYVPRISIFHQNCENSDYTNQSYDNKNCYLCSAIGDCDSLLYSQNATHLRSCIDVSYSQNSELLYECVDCYDSYKGVCLQQCIQCSDSWFLYDCINCRHCYKCVGLRNKEYCIANQQFSKQEYEKYLAAIKTGSHDVFKNQRKNFEEFILPFPRVAGWLKQSENVTGNNIRRSHNLRECFDVFEVEDCSYASWVFESRDVFDAYGLGKSELVYECIGVERVTNVFCCTVTSDAKDCYYTDLCFSCSDCFGCIGLRNKRYCILNKQYSEEEYRLLVPKIIQKMRSNGEWGEFFPVKLSPFAYNETIAVDAMPLTQEEVLKMGWKWRPEDAEKDQYLGPIFDIPMHIDDVSNDITKQILRCEITNKPYKIIPQELSFYKEMQLPIPRQCPEERRQKRMALRNPRHLWPRECAKCHKPIATTYAPDRPATVYCEECYLQTVY